MDGVVTRVGLQLLLEPSSTAWIARGACVATGAVYPAYATYKAVLAPKRALAAAAAGRTTTAAAAASLEYERWLKYWAVFGLACCAERMLEQHIDRLFPYYPHAKLAFLLWLQLHQGHGACLLFDAYLVPYLSRYERKLDTLLTVGAQLAEMLYSTYAGPISYIRTAATAALSQLAVFLKWLATPDDPIDTHNTGSSSSSADVQQQQQQQSVGSSSTRRRAAAAAVQRLH